MITRLTDDNKSKVLDLLSIKPLENIVLIADCTQLLQWCDVRFKEKNESIQSVFSVYKDLDFLAGAFWALDTEALASIVSDFEKVISNREMVLICTEHQLEVLKPLAETLDPIEERQMILDTCETVNTWGDANPEKFSREDAEELRELYRICGTPAWTAQAMDLGPFFGIRIDDKIVSVAGVHYVTEYGAELGNVATHPDYRGKGYASHCVKEVVCDLEKLTPTVFLHFIEDNTPAKRLYEKMGFRYSEVDPIYFVKVKFKSDIFSKQDQ